MFLRALFRCFCVIKLKLRGGLFVEIGNCLTPHHHHAAATALLRNLIAIVAGFVTPHY